MAAIALTDIFNSVQLRGVIHLTKDPPKFLGYPHGTGYHPNRDIHYYACCYDNDNDDNDDDDDDDNDNDDNDNDGDDGWDRVSPQQGYPLLYLEHKV
jgi:hypothetical protein